MANYLKLLLFIFVIFSLQAFSQHIKSASDARLPEDKNNFESEEETEAKPKQTIRQKRGGFVLSGYVGAAKTLNSSLAIRQPDLGNDLTFADLKFRTRAFESPLYYGLRGSYFIPQLPFLGFEAEFIHLKVYSDPQQRVRVTGMRRGSPISREIPLGEIVQQYSISHGANFLLFNVAARKGFRRTNASSQGRLIFTGRAGFGPTIPHTESRIDNQFQEQYEIGRLGWQAAGGAELKLWKGIYALGEYKFTRTNQCGKIFSGAAETVLETHHGVFGLSYHF